MFLAGFVECSLQRGHRHPPRYSVHRDLSVRVLVTPPAFRSRVPRPGRSHVPRWDRRGLTPMQWSMPFASCVKRDLGDIWRSRANSTAPRRSWCDSGSLPPDECPGPTAIRLVLPDRHNVICHHQVNRWNPAELSLRLLPSLILHRLRANARPPRRAAGRGARDSGGIHSDERCSSTHGEVDGERRATLPRQATPPGARGPRGAQEWCAENRGRCSSSRWNRAFAFPCRPRAHCYPTLVQGSMTSLVSTRRPSGSPPVHRTPSPRALVLGWGRCRRRASFPSTANCFRSS
jgi:hypothetical protein